jgi:hypothetical protein
MRLLKIFFRIKIYAAVVFPVAVFMLLPFSVSADDVYPVGRPYGRVLHGIDEVDFEERWNEDLESEKYHPIIQLQAPYWRSHKREHEQKLNIAARVWVEPFKWREPSFEMRFLYLQSNRWDQLLGAKDNSTYRNDELRFHTKGPSFEAIGRFHAVDYDFKLSWLRFQQREELHIEPWAAGYRLSFGGIVTEGSGLSRTKFDLITLINERVLEQREFSRSTLSAGLTFIDLHRFERLKGVDRQGINPFFSTKSGIAGDRITVEQGEELIKKDGPGLFLGGGYHSTLGRGVNWTSGLGVHILNNNTEQFIVGHRVAQSGVIESTSFSASHTEPEFLLDFNFRVQKYVREFYNVSLGFRYLHFLEAEDRVALSGESRKDFALKGVEIALQRFF